MEPEDHRLSLPTPHPLIPHHNDRDSELMLASDCSSQYPPFTNVSNSNTQALLSTSLQDEETGSRKHNLRPITPAWKCEVDFPSRTELGSSSAQRAPCIKVPGQEGARCPSLGQSSEGAPFSKNIMPCVGSAQGVAPKPSS